MGHGDGEHADALAVDAMRATLDKIDLRGRIVIGEGERDEAPMLYIGEEVGGASGPSFDIAVDPLEGTNLVATGSPNAVATMAMAETGGLLNAPDTYMEKLIVGPPAAGKVSLDYPVRENLQIIADALQRRVTDLTVVVLDRPRHKQLIGSIRDAGARIKLIGDGDLTAAVSVAVAGTADHVVMGTGGAPEGVLAAAALRCLGGEIQGRLKPRNDSERERLETMGVTNAENRILRTEDLASGAQLSVAITGVTDGDLLRGVRFFGGGARVHSLVMDLPSSTIRFVDSILILDRDHLGPVRLGPT
jgi:fructose-1,6-bisphosphatase II